MPASAGWPASERDALQRYFMADFEAFLADPAASPIDFEAHIECALVLDALDAFIRCVRVPDHAEKLAYFVGAVMHRMRTRVPDDDPVKRWVFGDAKEMLMSLIERAENAQIIWDVLDRY